MANMGYCRFENTLRDLADCAVLLDRIVCNEESISKREWECATMMRVWCERFIDIFDDIEEEDININ